MNAINQLEQFKSRASEYLSDPTFTQMRREGYGRSYSDAMARSALAGAKPQILGNAEQTKMSLATGGMQFSGLGARADADAIAGLAGVATDASMQADTVNRQVMQQAEQTAIQVQMQGDALDLQRIQSLAQIEASQPTVWDRVMQGATLVNMVTSRF